MTATVKVNFPNGPRDWPAFYDMPSARIGRYASEAMPADTVAKLTPVARAGWIFRETIDGQWFAYEVGE